MLFFHILVSLLLFVFGQTTKAIDVSSVKTNLQTESSIVAEKECPNKNDFLNSEIARPCNFESDFVNYWERDDRSLAKTGSNWLNKFDDLDLAALKKEVNLLDEATKAKFLDEFAGAGDDALKAMNDNTSLLSYWKSNGVLLRIEPTLMLATKHGMKLKMQS
jgi:hypothetical protein